MSDVVPHKLVIFDDSDLIRKALTMILGAGGYDVRAAASLEEFDELLTVWWPDTVLVDVQMPEVMGDQLCRTLKARLLVRVILFSNLPPERLAELASSSGADGYISKLDGLAELPRLLQDIIDHTAKSPAHL